MHYIFVVYFKLLGLNTTGATSVVFTARYWIAAFN